MDVGYLPADLGPQGLGRRSSIVYRVQVEKGHGGHRGGLVAATPLVGTESTLAPSLILAVVLLVLHFDFDGLGRGIV